MSTPGFRTHLSSTIRTVANKLFQKFVSVIPWFTRTGVQDHDSTINFLLLSLGNRTPSLKGGDRDQTIPLKYKSSCRTPSENTNLHARHKIYSKNSKKQFNYQSILLQFQQSTQPEKGYFPLPHPPLHPRLPVPQLLPYPPLRLSSVPSVFPC